MTKHLIYIHDESRLFWGNDAFECVSGPFGKGPAPCGKYVVRKRHVVNSPDLPDGFRDPDTGDAWFIPVIAMFKSGRYGLGIHPDGKEVTDLNTPGTLGCFGTRGHDTKRFFEKWMSFEMEYRPSSLLVFQSRSDITSEYLLSASFPGLRRPELFALSSPGLIGLREYKKILNTLPEEIAA